MGSILHTEPTTVHVIGKCPVLGCGRRRRNSLPGRIVTDRLGTHTEYRIPSVDPRYRDGLCPRQLAGIRPSRLASRHHPLEQALLASMDALGWVCALHDQFLTLRVVRGKVNHDKTCDHNCVTATGPDCECSCGGAQHGSAYDSRL